MGESSLDVRISELEEFLRKSYSSTNIVDNNSNDDNVDDYEFNNDDTITRDRCQHQQRASFLHDSTYKLCSQGRFSVFTGGDDNDETTTSNVVVRSNSLRIMPSSAQAILLDKAPKKVVRFADMLVCRQVRFSSCLTQCERYVHLNAPKVSIHDKYVLDSNVALCCLSTCGIVPTKIHRHSLSLV
jgi:hypothetical protein